MQPRTEWDSHGPVTVDPQHLWGPQTQRALVNFAISSETLPTSMVRALAIVKKVCAQVNRDLGVLHPSVAEAIQHACKEVLAGRCDTEFPVSVWQSGSGTQSHMNMNEVLAHLATRALPPTPGSAGQLVHPNDHVNLSQSTNDIFPTALHVAAALSVTYELLPAIRLLRTDIHAMAERHAALGKIGRTHLQDAVPMTVGQEWSAFDAQIGLAFQAIEHALQAILDLPVGGTAVGTGLNAPADFAAKVCAGLSDLLGDFLIFCARKHRLAQFVENLIRRNDIPFA